MSVAIPFFVILVMVAFNALYVTAEFATVGARRSRVQEAADNGSAAAARLLVILRDATKLDNYVAACQVGITLTSLVAGAYGQAQITPALEPLFGKGSRGAAIIVVLVAITALQVILGELLPKTAALRYPERLAMLVMPAIQVSQLVFRPFVALFNGSAFRLMRLMNLNGGGGHGQVHSAEELAGLYRASATGGLIDASEREMLAGVLSVEDRVVREIMTPRRRLETVPGSHTVAEGLAAIAASPHSRFPVTGDGDEVDGIVHVRDLFAEAQTNPDSLVSEMCRPALAVAEVLTVPRLWLMLRDQDHHCAFVVNEYGWVAGMVTLEDTLEEVFGEVQDEFDDEVDPFVIEGDRVWVRGDVLIDLLNDRFGLHVEPGEIETVSGLLWHELGRLPELGDEILIGPNEVALKVEELDGRAVARASFSIPESSS